MVVNTARERFPGVESRRGNAIASNVGNSCFDWRIQIDNSTCVEIRKENVDVFPGKGYDVRQGDFMGLPTASIFGRMVMNPPFGRQKDIGRAVRAFEFLK